METIKNLNILDIEGSTWIHGAEDLSIVVSISAWANTLQKMYKSTVVLHVLCLFLSSSPPAHILRLLEHTVTTNCSQTQETHSKQTRYCSERAHSAAQPDTSLNQTSVFTNYPQLSPCAPMEGRQHMGFHTHHHVYTLQKMSWWNNEEVCGVRQRAKLLFWKVWWPSFRWVYLPSVSLSKQALQFICFGSRLRFVVYIQALGASRLCHAFRAPWCQKQESFWEEDAACSEFKICI